MSYLDFKNVTNYQDTQISEQVEQNLGYFIDNAFLRIGGFSNVKLSVNDRTGISKSRLTKSSDPKVWNTFTRNLVYENIPGATSISGVYINNVFHAPNSAVYPHYVDYKQGSVVFQSGINVSSMHMEFSYKNVHIEHLDTNPWIKEFQYTNKELNLITDFTLQSGDFNRDRRTVVHLPLICAEVLAANYKPYELGNSTLWNNLVLKFYVFGQYKSQVSKIADILGNQKSKTIFYFDVNEVAKSGVYPLDFKGRKNTSGLAYDILAKPKGEGGYGVGEIYIADTSYNIGEFKAGLHYGVIKYQLELK